MLRSPATILQSLSNLTDPLRRYSRLVCHQSKNLDFGFALWTQYVARAFAETEHLGDRVLHLCYEDFLDEPEKHVTDVAGFCGVDPARGRAWASTARVERRFAFLQSPELRAFYERVRTNEWMQRLGYAHCDQQIEERVT